MIGTRRRSVFRAVAGIAMAVSGAVLVGGSLLGIGVSASASSRPAVVAHDTCPNFATCVSMPSGGGTVVASPAVGLSNDQWVDLKFSGFTPGHFLNVYYCSDSVPIAQASPECDLAYSTNLPTPGATVTTFSSGPAAGTSEVEVQVAEADATDPFTGTVPKGPPPNNPVPFECDGTSANPCSIDVVEPQLDSPANLVPDATNTAVIPVAFAAENGCPGANLVTTESEFGLDRLLPEVDALACQGNSSPAVAFNTAVNGVSAVQALSANAVQVAFTDDPESADQQAALKSFNGQVALIPIALTANVIGFRADMMAPSNNSGYPKLTFNLTPTQVAGVISDVFQGPATSDTEDCDTPGSGWCSDPDPNDCITGPCSLMSELNAQSGFNGPTVYGAFVRSDANGSTHQLLQWLCAAPDTPYPINGVDVTEPDPGTGEFGATAADTLVYGINNNLGPTEQPLTACPADSDVFPSLATAGHGNYAEVAQPSQQIIKLSALVGSPGNVTSSAPAGFAPENWGEAVFSGLAPANLENAAGQFVAPTAASLDAAVTDATINSDGSLTFDDTTTDPAAYPMASLIYAAVPTAAQPADSAQAEQSLLNNILDLTGGADTADLPGGFVPLPAALYQAAKADVTKDIVAQPSSSTGSGGGGGSTGSGGGSGTNTGGKSGSTQKTGTTTTPATTSTESAPASYTPSGISGNDSVTTPAGPTAVSPTSFAHRQKVKRTSNVSPPAPLAPLPHSLMLEATSDRLFLPSMIVLGLVVLLWGLLLLSHGARRRMLAAAGAVSPKRLRRPKSTAGGYQGSGPASP